MDKLALEYLPALMFARFLIEEKDEDDERGMIELDMNRQINSQYIPIRLMTFFNYYPAQYTIEETQQTIQTFLQAFD